MKATFKNAKSEQDASYNITRNLKNVNDLQVLAYDDNRLIKPVDTMSEQEHYICYAQISSIIYANIWRYRHKSGRKPLAILLNKLIERNLYTEDDKAAVFQQLEATDRPGWLGRIGPIFLVLSFIMTLAYVAVFSYNLSTSNGQCTGSASGIRYLTPTTKRRTILNHTSSCSFNSTVAVQSSQPPATSPTKQNSWVYASVGQRESEQKAFPTKSYHGGSQLTRLNGDGNNL